MGKRKTISKALRFDVFMRDGFSCQYCGGRPPAVLLEVDHIVPVAKGGGNELVNLTTACRDCNSGKSAKSLTVNSVQPSKHGIAREMKERAEQSEAYAEAVQAQRAALERQVEMVAAHWALCFGGQETETGWSVPRGKEFPSATTVRTLLRKISLEDMLQAVETTASRDPHTPDRYFYGICWSMARGQA